MIGPLFQHVLGKPEGAAGGGIVLVALLGLAVGMALWLAGSKFSRALITLVAGTIGLWAGMKLPLGIESPMGQWMAGLVGGALMGVSGYLLHKIWVGLFLAGVLAVWAGVGVWVSHKHGQTLELPLRQEGQVIADYARQVWEALPEAPKKMGPFLSGLGLIAGLGIAFMWARLASYLLYSLVGLSLMVVMGLLAMEFGRPAMLDMLPKQPSTQLGVLAGMVVFGAIAQWRMHATQKDEKAPA